MKILIVNDDSIHADGIAVLARAAMEFGQVYVVAPSAQCSAMSQKVTLREGLTVEKVEDYPVAVLAAYKVGGTPVDCVKVGLGYLLEDMPDLVLSGMNHGYNVGYDIGYSGTLGAAFEAARCGIPAIAFSMAVKAPAEAAYPYIGDILRELLAAPREPGLVWNVNFPRLDIGAPRGICRDCPVAPVGLYRERYVERTLPDGRVELEVQGIPTEDELIPAGTDGDVVRRGYIAISRLSCSHQTVPSRELTNA